MMMVAISIVNGSVSIQFIKICDQNYLARAGAVMNASTAAAMPIASFLVSLLSVRFSPAFLIAACSITMIVLLIMVAFSKLDFELEKTQEVSDAA